LAKKLDFEESLVKLEEITRKLEAGELSLDESLKIFEEGIRLSRYCEKKLTEVEHKLEILKSTEIPDEADSTDGENPYKEDDEEPASDQKKKAGKTKKNSDEENLLF
jgi:exodeoxyribonuclease VII small subunit